MRRPIIAIVLLSGFMAGSSASGAEPYAAAQSEGNDPSGHQATELLVDRVRILKGFQIAPVPLNLQGKNRALVGLGSYIVNAQGGCNDCHTAPPYQTGGDPYQEQVEVINTAHYLAGGMPFGSVTSRNITPDSTGRPAGLTREEFIQVMRTGRDPDQPDAILQVMPWPVYGKMTDRDLAAIYEYLRAIPHADPPATP